MARLAERFNFYFSMPENRGIYERVISCSEKPFDSRRVDLPEMPPCKGIPPAFEGTFEGRMMKRGMPAMRGVVNKYWIECETPDGSPDAFAVAKKGFPDMPPEFNNVGWMLVSDDGSTECMGLHFVL